MARVVAIVFIIFNLPIIALTVWCVLSYSNRARSMRLRLPTMLGGLTGVISLFLPWISFSILEDLVRLPVMLIDLVPTALEILGGVLEFTPLGIIAWLVERAMSMPGFVLVVILPRGHPLVRWAVLAPAIGGTFSMITGLVSFIAAGRRAGRIAGWCQLCISLLALLNLVGALPWLDQLGAMGNPDQGLPGVLIGAGLGVGAWAAVGALVVMMAGAAVTLAEIDEQTSRPDPGYGNADDSYYPSSGR